MKPRVVVVLPHHHRRDLLATALAAVAGWPCVVVDDGPRGPSVLHLGDPVIVLRSAGEVGFASAVNLGLAHAQDVLGADLVLLLNDDAEPAVGCVDALVSAWSADIGALGPVLMHGQQVESAGLELTRWGRVRQRTHVPAGPTAVRALSGACLLVPAWARMDPAYGHGFEDLDLCRRLRHQGLQVALVPAARCQHVGGASLGRATRRAQRHAVSGHLRLVDGGWVGAVAVGLAVAQVVREGGPPDRLLGVAEGVRDWLSSA